ncbi:MAG: alcohol dehydrogenase catalytic domain-containing protein [Nitrospiraceae bacterium]
MKALVKSAPQPGLTYTDRPDPSPGPTDAVIRVKATSLCGTDAHIYNWDAWAHSRIHPPRIIGHEMCGEVVAVGADVTLVKVGDYVAAESHLTCGACFQCRTGQAHVCKRYRILGVDLDGSFAEFIVLPETVLWKTSPDIPAELASVQEPLGNAVDAALVEDLTGHTVLVTGCGPTGLFAAAVARTAGAATIIATDVSDYRLGLAKQVGVDHTLNTKTDGADAVTQPFRTSPKEKGRCGFGGNVRATRSRCTMRSAPSRTAVASPCSAFPATPSRSTWPTRSSSRASASTASRAVASSAPGTALPDSSKPASTFAQSSPTPFPSRTLPKDLS